MNVTADWNIDRSMLINECLEALALVLEYDMNDNTTHQHAIRVGEGCVLIGHKLGLPPATLQKMYYAGLLHDVGKISVDPRLLGRKGRLSEEEFNIVKTHTIFGSRILAALPGLSEMSLWVRWHHEWWNGTGYPDGLIKTEIPLEVQILSTVDCFDSLQSPRLDRDRRSQAEAFRIMEDERGTHFNPDMLDSVLEMVHEKTLLPGESSPKFLELKEEYLTTPLSKYTSEYWQGSGMAALHPILRLFARVIDAKHKYTRGHSTRVAYLSKFIAEKMGLPVDHILQIEVAGLLHDAGKVSVSLEILDKPAPPDANEWEVIRMHPQKSLDILLHISSLQDIAAIAASHHERYDGKGYPKGLKGDEIPILSRVIAVADSYDAMTSNRAYRKGMPAEIAYNKIKDGISTQFDPKITKAFLDISPKYIQALFSMYEVEDV